MEVRTEEEKATFSRAGEFLHGSGTRRPLRPEVVLNGAIDPQSTKADNDETLKENRAAEEAALQVQITNAQAAAEAFGDDPAFAKQAADLRSEITRLEKKAAGGKGGGAKFSGSSCGAKITFRGKGDQQTGAIEESLGNGTR